MILFRILALNLATEKISKFFFQPLMISPSSIWQAAPTYCEIIFCTRNFQFCNWHDFRSTFEKLNAISMVLATFLFVCFLQLGNGCRCNVPLYALHVPLVVICRASMMWDPLLHGLDYSYCSVFLKTKSK